MLLRVSCLLLLSWTSLLTAQGSTPPVEIRDLRAVPRDIADEVQRVFNATGTRRVSGDHAILSSETVNQDVAVLAGQLVITGQVTGNVVIINGSVVVRDAGRVSGSATAIGGTVTTIRGGQVDGSTRSYPEHVLVESADSVVVVRDETEDERWYRNRMAPKEGSRSELRLVTAKTYNRVEGLPLLLGPRFFKDFFWGRLTADGMAVLRSADQFALNSETVGHMIRLELQLGGARGIRIAGRLNDVVAPVEEWQLSHAEVGVASFLLHRDYRDYFNGHGGSISATGFIGKHLDATISWTDERWAAPTARDPWSLFRNGQDWRPNPVLDEGHFRLIRFGVRFDSRNDVDDPWAGWYASADYEYGIGNITSYGPTSRAIRDINPTGRNNYDRVMIDVRRYNRVSAEGQLNWRIVAGGWLSGDDLPLQARYSLGGPGSLPGYDFRQVMPGTDYLTCAGTRPEDTPGGPRTPPGSPAQCERFALAQIEYRGEFGSGLFGLLDQQRRRFRLGWGRKAEWVVFADVGRGWLVGPNVADLQYSAGSFPDLRTFRADVGLGVRLDDIGLYIGKSITDPHTPINFFARLQPRF
jgi:Omp85 superfamily domain